MRPWGYPVRILVAGASRSGQIPGICHRWHPYRGGCHRPLPPGCAQPWLVQRVAGVVSRVAVSFRSWVKPWPLRKRLPSSPVILNPACRMTCVVDRGEPSRHRRCGLATDTSFGEIMLKSVLLASSLMVSFPLWAATQPVEDKTASESAAAQSSR